MPIIILAILILITAVLGGYTLNFQKTTVETAKKLSGDKLTHSRMQDLLTPASQSATILVFPFLILGVLVFSLFFFKWYLALTFGALSYILASVARSFVPRGEAPALVRRMRRNLEKKLRKAKKDEDADDIRDISEAIRRFDGAYRGK